MAEEKNFRSLSTLVPGDKLEMECYLLREASVATARDGKPYLDGVIADKDTSMPIRIWDYRGPVDATDAGAIVCVSGAIGDYKGRIQANLTYIRRALPMDKYDEEDLIPKAPINAENAKAQLECLLDSISDAELKTVCKEAYAAFGKDFVAYPAAKKIHHAFKHGLLMHTLNMMVIADQLARIYPITNRDMLLAGTFLHDLGKLSEFTLGDTGLVSEYSLEGELLGHLVIGAEAVVTACKNLGVSYEKSLMLQHMLVSHHGEPEYGAAKLPATPEAILLSMIDAMDSRMEIVTETLNGVNPGEFSERIPVLDNRKLYKPTF